MKRELAGRRFVLTGAAGGIGALVARQLLLEEHASCVLVDRNVEALDRLAAELQAKAGGDADARFQTMAVDLAKPEGLDALVAGLGDEPIAGLINNAGVAYAGPFAEMPLDAIERILAVNLLAPVRLTRLLLPRLIASQGAIVNVASGAGLVGPAGLAAYAASKFALVGFSEALRGELRGVVSVTAICPAFVATSLVQNSAKAAGAAAASAEATTTRLDDFVKRVGIAPERVSAAIVSALQRGPGTVPVSAAAHVLWGIKKLLPGTVDYLNHRQFRKVVDEGLYGR